MSKNLSKQVYVYSLTTDAFYSEKEKEVSDQILELSLEKKELKESDGDVNGRIKEINQLKKELKEELKNLFALHNGIRQLDSTYLKEKNIISVFDSVLTRTLGIEQDNLAEDIMIVQTYYHEVFEDLINNGFVDNNGEKFIYFSSSAGQIRTKKGVFIKESKWDEHKLSLMNGLRVEDINKQGGMSVNKFLAYKALTNSASEEWLDFDINKTIVVDDVEVNVNGMVDYIDRNTYEIARQQMDVPVEITDGAGMILPNKSNKAFMCRLPFVKGMLMPFPFDKFAEEHNSYIIKDIYGNEHNIIEEDIEIIFFKSQFKMWKYYNSWEHYKESFIKYNCHAARLNDEEDEIPDAKLNYQMLQTLTDATDKELKALSQDAIEDIKSVGSDKETMLRILGVAEGNRHKNYLQQALYLHNELLNDKHSKKVIKDKKKSMVRDAKAGKLSINGKYTYLSPDFYGVCQRVFLGVEQPKGLLGKDEVSCNLFNEGELAVERSPHLYREHGIKENIITDEMKKWFVSNAIYTSSHDLLSKMLQFDVDGDKALVIDDPTFLKVAKRNMEGIVPLYYEMGAAPKQEVSSENIYKSLKVAFKANIGVISNKISKVWNHENYDLDVVKWLTAYNNFLIDYAKTLDLPEMPEEIDTIIKGYTKSKLPHFFHYAKDKDKKNVEEVNDSTVNRLESIIPNKRIHFKSVAGKFDYKILMKNPRTKLDDEIIERYTYLDRRKKWIMNHNDEIEKNEKLYVYKFIREELLKLHNDVNYITDVLIKHLYYSKDSENKTTLWESFGDVIIKNLEHNINGTKDCEECGTAIKRQKGKKYCEDCAKKREALRVKQFRTHERKTS